MQQAVRQMWREVGCRQQDVDLQMVIMTIIIMIMMDFMIIMIVIMMMSAGS
jgi:hypothetical protein